jgi:hypothetical protein
VTDTVVEVLTEPAVAARDTLVPPAGNVTLAGVGNAVGLSLVKVTLAPPVGAGALSPTASITAFPLVTLPGLIVRLLNIRAVTLTDRSTS